MDSNTAADDSYLYWWGICRIAREVGIPFGDAPACPAGYKLHSESAYYIPENVLIFPRPYWRGELAN